MSFDFVCLVIIKSIALFMSIWNWRFLPLAYRLVFFITLLSLTVEVIGRYVAVVMHQGNLQLFNVYALVQMLVLGYAGWLLVYKKSYKRIIVSLLVIETCHWLWYVLNVDVHKFFNWFFVLSALLLVIAFILVLIENALFKNQKIFTQPLSLICISYILIFGSTIPLFGVMNVLTATDMAVADALFRINLFANILGYALIAIAFYLYGKQAGREYVRQ